MEATVAAVVAAIARGASGTAAEAPRGGVALSGVAAAAAANGCLGHAEPSATDWQPVLRRPAGRQVLTRRHLTAGPRSQCYVATVAHCSHLRGPYLTLRHGDYTNISFLSATRHAMLDLMCCS